MADNVTTSNAGGSSKKSKVPEGYEEITVVVPKDRDQVLSARLISQLEGPKQTVVGNFADLQRMGTATVTGGKPEDGVLAPPVTTDDNGDTQDFNPQPLEDVIAPGPVAFGADAAEAAFGDRVAQGERPDNK